ncbi:MAG: hypothetical protein NUW24_14940, partial [Anaerolineae bacterium]|nr:hypothetical protein [Anaerolineae bacterium]
MKVIRTATVVVFLSITMVLPAQAGPLRHGPPPQPPNPTDETLISQLQQETEGKVRIHLRKLKLASDTCLAGPSE